MKKIFVGKGDLASRDALYDFLGERLALPAYFGRNLDALYDVLTELSEPVRFYLPTDVDGALAAVFRDAAEVSPAVGVKFYRVSKKLHE